MRRHNGELFQIEVDALQAYAPEEFKNLVQQSVDKYFDQHIYNEVLSDPLHSEEGVTRLVRKKVKSLLKNLK